MMLKSHKNLESQTLAQVAMLVLITILLLLSRLKQFLHVIQMLHPWALEFSLSASAILVNVRPERENAYDILKNVINISKTENIPTEVASRKLAEERINAVSNAKRIRIYRDANLFKLRNS